MIAQLFAFLGPLITVTRLIAGGLDDKPMARAALLTGAGIAEDSLRQIGRYLDLMQKIEALPPGVDFTQADMAEIMRNWEAVTDEFEARVARHRAAAAEAIVNPGGTDPD